MIFIPSYAAISGDFKELINQARSNSAIEKLFNAYILSWPFDAYWYLESNPDLSAAIPSNDFPTAFAHFSAVGYMEGRLPVKPTVDPSWYMANYSDVAAAIIKGTFESAAHHFSVAGYKEGRLPGDPEIDSDWYVSTYVLQVASTADKPRECLHHFMTIGYLNGALPRQKVT